MYGALGIALCLSLIAQTYSNQIKDSACFWAYIDNESVIKKINNQHKLTPSDTLCNEFELFEELRSILQSLPFTGVWRWIKGHDECDESPAGRMNKCMDEAAGTMRRMCIPVNNLYPLPNSSVTIRQNNQILHYDIEKKILFDKQDKELIQYMKEKYKWSNETYNDIAWEAIRPTLNAMSLEKQIVMTKMMFQWIDTGERRKIIEENTSDTCPYCSETETYQHVFKCPNNKMMNIWSEIRTFLTELKTSPLIKKCLEDFYKGKIPLNVEPHDEHEMYVAKAIEAQKKLGCNAIWCGHISRLWGKAQRIYEARRKINISNWEEQVVPILLEYSLKIWKQRNEILHSSELENENLQKLEQRARREQKMMKKWIHPSINAMTMCDIGVIGTTYQGLLKWFDTVTAAKIYSKKMFVNCMTSQRKLTDYFIY